MFAHPVLNWLRPSVLEGAWLLHRELTASQESDVTAIIRLLQSTYSSSGFDFDTASALLSEVPIALAVEREHYFRTAFLEAMRRARPPFLELLTQGREPFFQALPPDAAECFRRCGASTTHPNSDVMSWLDALAALARANLDEGKMLLARAAERLTVDRETERLSVHVNSPPIQWVSLDDNSAGFAVRSYKFINCIFEPRLIEVKASNARRPEFFLTRNEVQVARQNANRYLLHVWHVNSRRLIEVPWVEIEEFIPIDTSRAEWTEVHVRWPNW
jgi:hypothetical protein